MAVNEIVCGKTPLQHVLLHDYRLKKHVVDYLLAHGADVNGRDLDGNTGTQILPGYYRTPIISLSKLLRTIIKKYY